jgi:hypothetical protein
MLESTDDECDGVCSDGWRVLLDLTITRAGPDDTDLPGNIASWTAAYALENEAAMDITPGSAFVYVVDAELIVDEVTIETQNLETVDHSSAD